MVSIAPFSLLRPVTRPGLVRVLASQPLPSFDGTQQRRWRSSRKTGARLKPVNDAEFASNYPSPVQVPHPDAYPDTQSQNIIDKSIGLVPARRVPEELLDDTGALEVSAQKFNDLARLIRRKPLENAILQMEYSSKRISNKIKLLLEFMRSNARTNGMDVDKLIVDRAWVTKSTSWKEVHIRARGRAGLITHPRSVLHVVLKHGKSKTELDHEKDQAFIKKALRSGPDTLSYNRSISNMGIGRGVYGW